MHLAQAAAAGKDVSFLAAHCGHVLVPAHHEVFVVDDLHKDARFAPQDCMLCWISTHASACPQTLADSRHLTCNLPQQQPPCRLSVMGILNLEAYWRRIVEGVPDRFYAAAPLVASSGHRVGTFCIGCSTPKTLTAHQVRSSLLSHHVPAPRPYHMNQWLNLYLLSLPHP